MNWDDVLPRGYAIRQAAWERSRAAMRARAAGLTYKQIGERFGVGVARARGLIGIAEYNRERGHDGPPILEYFRQTDDVAELARSMLGPNNRIHRLTQQEAVLKKQLAKLQQRMTLARQCRALLTGVDE